MTINKNSSSARHSRESGNPGCKPDFKCVLKNWIPTFAGMTTFGLVLLFLSACSPTYTREKIHQQIKDLAKKDYKLTVDVEELGQTISIRYSVKDLMGELMASDQQVWTQIENLMVVLSRIALSSDRPPEFIVLDIMDVENPRVHLVFTRYVKDLQKMMAEGISRTQFLDRLLIEFVIGNKRTLFDPSDTDLVRFMMMGVDTEMDAPKVNSFKLEEIQFPDFLAKVAAKSAQRLLRDEKKIDDDFMLRDVTGQFENNHQSLGQFQILLDLVSRPNTHSQLDVIEKKILPFVASEIGDIFKSYQFKGFNSLTIVEKNSGKILTIGRAKD